MDKDDRERREKKFTATLRNQPMPPNSLWSIDIASKQEKRLTNDATFSASGFSLSNDGRWAGVRGIRNDRYARNITEEGISGDLWLVNLATGACRAPDEQRRNRGREPLVRPGRKDDRLQRRQRLQVFPRSAALFVRAIDANGGCLA